VCLAIPARVVEIDPAGEAAVVSLGGVRKAISLALVDGVTAGDYVLVHVGYALARVDASEAEKTLALLDAVGRDEAFR
jgi:hydrogenase expression/formation protein HypC